MLFRPLHDTSVAAECQLVAPMSRRMGVAFCTIKAARIQENPRVATTDGANQCENLNFGRSWSLPRSLPARRRWGSRATRRPRRPTLVFIGNSTSSARCWSASAPTMSINQTMRS